MFYQYKIISSALCNWIEVLSWCWRPSVKPDFPETVEWTSISIFFFFNFKFWSFMISLWDFYFRFDHMGEKNNNSSESTQQNSPPPLHHVYLNTSREGLYQSPYCEISNFVFLPFFFFVFGNVGPYGRKSSMRRNYTTSLKVHTRFAVQNWCILGSVFTKVVKLRIVKFDIGKSFYRQQ